MSREFFLRTSERRDLGRCPQRWWWAWREGLRPIGDPADALWFGSGIHIALAEWYRGPGAKRGAHPAETWVKYAEDSLRAIKIERAAEDHIVAYYEDAVTLGRVMMEGYVTLYGRDEQKLIIQPEKTFRLEVPWPTDQVLYAPEDVPSGPMLIYVGTYDGVWRHADTGQIWLDEHKSAKAISTGHLPLDPQAGSYWAVATRGLRAEGFIKPTEALTGIEYNFMRKSLPDDRPKDAEGHACNKPTKAQYVSALDGVDNWTTAELRKMKLADLEGISAANHFQVLGERSKIQSPELFLRVSVRRTRKERASQLIRLQQEGLMIHALRDGILPVLKNPTRECAMGGMSCQFLEMCELHEAGGDWQSYKKAAYEVQDPYTDHRQKGADDGAT